MAILLYVFYHRILLCKLYQVDYIVRFYQFYDVSHYRSSIEHLLYRSQHMGFIVRISLYGFHHMQIIMQIIVRSIIFFIIYSIVRSIMHFIICRFYHADFYHRDSITGDHFSYIFWHYCQGIDRIS